MNIDEHIEAFDKVIRYRRNYKDINSTNDRIKWNCSMNIMITKKVDLLERLYGKYSNTKVYEYNKPDIYMDLLTVYFTNEHDKRYDPMKAKIPTYVKHFVNRELSKMIYDRRYEMNTSYNNKEYDDQIYYPDENSDLASDYEAREKMGLLQKYAEKQDKLDEFRILVGLKDYDDFVEKYSKEYNNLKQRVSQLRKGFEDWYEAQ